MSQQSLFDQAARIKAEHRNTQAELDKERGINLVYLHADSYWKRAAADRLMAIINSDMEYFTSDDVLLPLEEAGITTRDTRALASLFLAARKVGLIETTDEFVRCRRPQRHGAPIRRWAVCRRAK